MVRTWNVAEGRLYIAGKFISMGYSGQPNYKNNPKYEGLKEKGPIPRGVYIMREPIDTATHGPFVIWLTPSGGNEMYGRGSFGVHGDSVVHPGAASLGCIVLPRQARELLWGDGSDLFLNVV